MARPPEPGTRRPLPPQPIRAGPSHSFPGSVIGETGQRVPEETGHPSSTRRWPWTGLKPGGQPRLARDWPTNG